MRQHTVFVFVCAIAIWHRAKNIKRNINNICVTYKKHVKKAHMIQSIVAYPTIGQLSQRNVFSRLFACALRFRNNNNSKTVCSFMEFMPQPQQKRTQVYSLSQQQREYPTCCLRCVQLVTSAAFMSYNKRLFRPCGLCALCARALFYDFIAKITAPPFMSRLTIQCMLAHILATANGSVMQTEKQYSIVVFPCTFRVWRPLLSSSSSNVRRSAQNGMWVALAGFGLLAHALRFSCTSCAVLRNEKAHYRTRLNIKLVARDVEICVYMRFRVYCLVWQLFTTIFDLLTHGMAMAITNAAASEPSRAATTESLSQLVNCLQFNLHFLAQGLILLWWLTFLPSKRGEHGGLIDAID